MGTKTLYVREEDAAIVKEAARLLAFHEDISVSLFLVNACKEVIRKYEPNPPTKQEQP